MNRYIFAAVALTLSHAALACTCGTGTTQVGDVCVADKSKAASVKNANTLGQGQSQTQGQGQSQTATGGNAVTGASTSQSGANAATGASTSAANGGAGGSATADQSQGNGNSQSSSTTYTEPRSPVMTAFAMASNTTAECRYGDALGFQTFGVGFSGSKSRADKDCRLKVMADVEYTRGNNMAGDKLTCRISYVHDALGDDCEGLLNEQPKYTPKQYSQAEVAELLRKQAGVLKAGK